ncbi:MAG TPA: DsbA family protein [Gemmatimonadaceae bacterium]|nr:DsbA family protein [Gemmatimonadaceae bacterium]
MDTASTSRLDGARSGRGRILDWLTLAVSASALVVAGLVFLKSRQSGAEVTPAKSRDIANWIALASAGHSVGAAAPAKQTMIVFEDFQCPFCGVLEGSLRTLRVRRPELRIVYRHFPLAQHPYAMSAAVASECAGKQGRFEAFHDSVFARQSEIGLSSWVQFAHVSGVRDTTAFVSCIRDDTLARANVRRDLQEAIALSLLGTPSVIINGKLLGDASIQSIERELRAGK